MAKNPTKEFRAAERQRARLEELVLIWNAKIRAAIKYKERWENRFKCDILEKYYEGFQYAEDEEGDNLRFYVVNLFYSAIDSKMPTFIFNTPRFHIKPSGSALAENPEYAFFVAQNRQDAINEWATQEELAYGEMAESAVLDACFRFGIIEYGYSADYIENPLAQKPALKGDYQYTYGEGKNRLGDLVPVVQNEKIYAKWISAKQFFVSTFDGPTLDMCDWSGYFEYVRTEDLIADDNLKNRDQLDHKLSGHFYSEDLAPSEAVERAQKNADGVLINSGQTSQGDLTKIWKIWDHRRRVKYIFAEGCAFPLLYDVPFKEIPFEDIRFKRRTSGGWYPMPLTWNWVHSQNEQNESKEAQRMHRRRFKRLYQILRSAVQDVDEVQNALAGPDGTCIEVTGREAITPVQNADLGTSANIALQTSKDDFLVMSGTSADQLGQQEGATATQVQYTANRAAIRENSERTRVGKFLVRGARKVLLLMQSHMVEQFAVSDESGVSRMLDPMSDLGDENTDFKVFLEVDSQSPIANDEEKSKFLEFLALLSRYPQFAMSPLLVRELAFRTGYRNERVIQEFMQMAQLQMLGMVSMGQQSLQQQFADQPPATSSQDSSLSRVNTKLRGQGVPVR